MTALQKLAYVVGAAGWVIGDRLLMTWALFVYSPPPGEGLPERLPSWALFGVITCWGLVSLAARVVDSVTDPLVASFSDRSRHPLGRRRVFMLAGVVPLAICTAAVFFPPVAAPSWLNVGYVAVALAAYFTFFTVYACPYQALLADLPRSSGERLQLSMFQAIASLAGAAMVMVGSNAALAALGSLDGPTRYQAMAAGFAVFSCALMLVPIVLVPEPKLVQAQASASLPVVESVLATLRAPGMGWYLVGNVALWFGFNIVASGVPYFVTVLMKERVEVGGTVLTVLFVITAVCFPVIARVAARVGKRKTMIATAASFGVIMALVPLIDDLTSGLVILGLAGVPVAAMMAVPNAMLADLARSERRRTGESREAMFFGAQAFFMKVNLGLSAAVLAAMLQLGKSVAEPLGVTLLGPVTAAIMVLSVFAFWRFREPGLDEEHDR